MQNFSVELFEIDKGTKKGKHLIFHSGMAKYMQF